MLQKKKNISKPKLYANYITKLTAKFTTNVKIIKNNAQKLHENSDNGRRFTLAINVGLKNATKRLIAPAPRFAHFASGLDIPIDSNMETE